MPVLAQAAAKAMVKRPSKRATGGGEACAEMAAGQADIGDVRHTDAMDGGNSGGGGAVERMQTGSNPAAARNGKKGETSLDVRRTGIAGGDNVGPGRTCVMGRREREPNGGDEE